MKYVEHPRAFANGWNAAIAGRPRECRAHVAATARDNWFAGDDAACRESEEMQKRKDEDNELL